MTKVLLVDDDALFARSVARRLEVLGFEVQQVSSVDDALNAIEDIQPDVALVDLDLGHATYDGIELIRVFRRSAPATRSVLMSAVASARHYKLAIRRGAVDVLVKPFEADELEEAIDRALACDSGFHGDVHGLSLIEILQMYHFSGRAVGLDVEGERPGRIELRDGDIVFASCGDERGEPALHQILRMDVGSVRTGAAHQIQPNISRRFDAVLLDGLRQLDEAARGSGASDSSGELGELDFSDLDFEVDSVGEQAQRVETNTEEGTDSMGKIDDSCKSVIDNTDGGIACGVVDLDTGMLLGIHNSAQYSQSLNEIVAAAAVNMFRGSNVGRINKAVRQHRGIPEDGAHYIEEVQFSSKNNFHFCKTIKGGKAVIILVTNKTTNIGMGWAQLKSVIPDVEPLVP